MDSHRRLQKPQVASLSDKVAAQVMDDDDMNRNRELVHQPVLCAELIDHLAVVPGGVYVDATAGFGGHARRVWELLGDRGLLILCDRDPESIRALHQLVAEWSTADQQQHKQPPQCVIMHQRFSQLPAKLKELGVWGRVNGLYADLGLSSAQLDRDYRGFSFMRPGPVDMRMGLCEQSVAEYLSEVSEEELADILYKWGGEPRARRIARTIVSHRDHHREVLGGFSSTHELAEVIRRGSGYRGSRKHPATKSFQALRMRVNDEAAELKALLSWSYEALAPQGRCGIISFHSLEDGPVKHFMKRMAQGYSGGDGGEGDEGRKRHHDREIALSAASMSGSAMSGSAMDQGVDVNSRRGQASGSKVQLIKPFPINPTDQEREHNPRSRSARLRVCEKL